MLKALRQLPWSSIAKLPIKMNSHEEPGNVEATWPASTVQQVTVGMINNRSVKEVLIWMAVSKKMVHSDMPKCQSYDSLASKYGIIW